MSFYFSRMMKSLEVERVRSRAAGDRDSDTIIDLRTALEIEREIRNGIAGKVDKIFPKLQLSFTLT